MLQTKSEILLNGALDGLAARHRAFAQNIANVETPGYKAIDVRFEDQLRRVSDALNGQFAMGPEGSDLDFSEVADDQVSGRPDDNGVQVDTQIIRLEENAMTYEALSQAAIAKNEILKSAINEGRR